MVALACSGQGSRQAAQGRAGVQGFTHPTPHTAAFQVSRVGLKIWGHRKGERIPWEWPGPGQVHVLQGKHPWEPYLVEQEPALWPVWWV